MKLYKPSLSPLPAFFATVLLEVGYLVTLMAMALVAESQFGLSLFNPPAALHLVLVFLIYLAPYVIAAGFYAWASAGSSVSGARRWFQLGAATLLAPGIALLLFLLCLFILSQPTLKR